MGKESGIVTGIVVTVIGGLLLAWFGGVFSAPNPIKIINNDDRFCPNQLRFTTNDNQFADFSVKLSNKGSDGSLFMTLSSDNQNISIRKNEDGVLGENSTRKWFVDSKREQDFEFEVKRNNSNINNFTLVTNFGCTKFFCQDYTVCCNYNKKDIYSYELAGESC